MDVEYDFDETVFNIVRCNWADEVEDSIELELLSNSTGSDMSTTCTYNPTPAEPAMPLNLTRSNKHVAKASRGSRGSGGAGKGSGGVRLVKDRPCQKVNVGDKKQQKKKKTKGSGGESRVGNGSEKRKKAEDRAKGGKGSDRGSGKQVLKLGGNGSGANKKKESASRSAKDSPGRRTHSQPLPVQHVQQQQQHKTMTTPLLEKRGSRADTSSDWNMDKIKAVHTPNSPSKSPDSARKLRRGSSTNRSSGSSTSRSGCSTARSVASRADTEEWTRPLRINTDSSRSDSSRRWGSGGSRREMFHKRNR